MLLAGNCYIIMTRFSLIAVLAASLALSPAARADELQPATDSRVRAIGCLASAIAYEAGFEPLAGQQAVAEVILNRARLPGYPKTVCGVVFAGSERATGCQFSFACDGSLGRTMPAAVMANARAVAAAALDGLNPAQVSGATHYHADYVSPYWAPSLIRIVKIGAHIFYRAAGTRDESPVAVAFMPTGEPAIAKLGVTGEPVAASIAPASQPAAPPPRFAPWGLAPLPAPPSQ